jgi:DNA-binding LacI/PurR family transcriptional regulator
MSTGDKGGRVTMADVARAAGVSLMTVSFAFNRPARVSTKTRERVLATALALGYAGPDPSARSLRRGSTRTLGVVLGEHLTYAFEDPQATSFLAGVAQVCVERGFGLTIVPIVGSEEDAARVAATAVDAFIVWTTTDDDPVLEAVRTTRRPMVIHGGPAMSGAAFVGIDNRAAARAIGLIAFAKSEHPAVLSFPLDRARASFLAHGVDPAMASFPVTRERLGGFRDAANELGIPWTGVAIAVASVNSAAEAERVSEPLLSTGHADAIAAMSDQQAIGVLRAARSAGLIVPSDLALTGWDDTREAADWSITTVAQSLREQGVACAVAVLDGQTEPQASTWTIVRRGSA